MKITKRVREQAAMICAVAASTPWLRGDYASAAFELELEHGPLRFIARDQRCAASQLAFAAWDCAFHAWCSGDDPDMSRVDAEAEAMIRTGWAP